MFYSLSTGFLILSLVATLILSHFRQHTRADGEGCKPPPSYPHIDPIFGLDSLILCLRNLQRGNLMNHLDNTFKRIQGGVYTYSTNFLGSRVIYTIEPENVKTIFATRYEDYGQSQTRKDALAIFGPGIFTLDGAQWQASRALLRPNFVRSQIGDMSRLEVHVRQLIEKIPKHGKVVDLQPLFGELTMDSATELMLGESTNLLSGTPRDEARRFMDAFTYASEGLSFRMGIGWLATLMPDPKFHQCIRDMKAFVNIYVRRALALQNANKGTMADNGDEEEGARYVFLPHLARSGYDEKRLAAELMAVIVAGGGTTSSLLTVLWFTLARRPDVFSKLRNEVLSSFETQLPNFEDVKGLKYLNWTIREVQRLYPVIPVNSRIALKDTILPLGGGKDGRSPIFLSKSTRVLHFPYSMHHRKDIYGDDADEFRPERWESLRTSWEYLPFSGGPRTCIGQQHALTEALYTTVRLLQSFEDVQPGDSSVWAEKLVLSMSVRSGCKVKLTTQTLFHPNLPHP
ncbi:putative cytochrome P450 alkane hydroxylase [Mytilinidion resinicola]|uniref:Cytochrome P450 alkane hydroxylase n=1 Tax=Mytilinidion resinicola TaxID=574789 RepID=A0A6A6Y4W3_9PEZI|nr:putative cytochrome P450 alkane hydroxylase [Mytilinidion resinicola]KAF2803064.1 putative cytochrome P450 alkane hydroxylase [Mytilinidion resinicola]